ncbi:MAG: insulinase family protein, partial [Odoribacter sp.]|nr:insulinase family protein [Odoribacter sp.]
GLFIFSGKISDGVSIEKAEEALLNEITGFIHDPVTDREFEKILNKTEARISYSEINYQNKAANLAYFEFLGDLELINHEKARYEKISIRQLKETARKIFRTENCSTLLYLK